MKYSVLAALLSFSALLSSFVAPPVGAQSSGGNGGGGAGGGRHGHGHVAHTLGVPTYCDESVAQFEADGGFSRFVQQMHHVVYKGGASSGAMGLNPGNTSSTLSGITVDTVIPERPVGLGFELVNENIKTASFKSTSTGVASPEVAYIYQEGNNFFIFTTGVQQSTSAKGVTSWYFNRANSEAPEGTPIFKVFFSDFGNFSGDAFSDTVFDITVNGLPIVPTRSLEQECIGG